MLAGLLRFTGLGWGLRHEPHGDERVFVESVRAMIAAGDFDHRYYEYPGLFFYLLSPVVALAPEGVAGSGAYLASRGLVAAFGVLGCLAVYRLGSLLDSREAALLGALLMAVSPLAVHTAHMVRPDVVLQVVVTMALVALLRVGGRPRADLVVGAVIGAAVAVKFSGAFLVPTYAVRRLLAPGPRVRGAVLATVALVAIFFVATPYALVHPREFVAGLETQVGHHYEEPEGSEPAERGLALAYAAVWPRALGAPAAAFALAGAVIALETDARRWLPLIVLPLVTVAVMGSQRLLFWRHLLPSLGVVVLLAALCAERVSAAVAHRLRADRRAVLAVLAVILAALPLVNTLAYVRDVVRPGTRDRALDWVQAHVPAGSRVLTSVERIGLERAPVELTRVTRLAEEDRPLVAGMDYVVATTADDARAFVGLSERQTWTPESPVAGPAIVVFAVPPSVRPNDTPVPLSAEMLSASENPGDLHAACDGRPDTLWRTADPQRPGDWLMVTLPAAERIGRIELLVDGAGRFAARELSVLVGAEGRSWVPARTLAARPTVDRQRPEVGPPSQVLVLTPPVRTRAVRLTLRRSGAHRWGVAELRLFAVK